MVIHYALRPPQCQLSVYYRTSRRRLSPQSLNDGYIETGKDNVELEGLVAALAG